MASVLASSLSGEPQLDQAPAKVLLVTRGAPAPSPLLKGGEPLRIPSAALAVEDRIVRVLKIAHERGVVRHELFQEAMGAMSRPGGELVEVDARLKAEGLRLVEEWLKLKVAINLGRHQRGLDNTKAEASLATSREACARALEEGREADRRREVVEKCVWELQAWSASLERQVEARESAQASMKGTHAEEEEILKHEEALALEAIERSLELERLETRERQVAQAEDAANAREARIQKEVDSRMAEARADIVGRYDLKQELVEAEAVGWTTALRTELGEVEQSEKATTAALVMAQAELASARVEMLSLQK